MPDEKPNDEGTNSKAMAAGAGASAGTDTGAAPPKTENMVPQSRLDEYARKVRDLEKREADRAKAESDAEEARLKEQAQWQKLAESKADELAKLKADLEPKAALVADLTLFVNDAIDAEIKDWPDEVKSLVPGADNVKARAAEVEKLRPLASKLSTQPTAPGNPRGPKPAGGVDPAKRQQQTRETVAGQRAYSL